MHTLTNKIKGFRASGIAIVLLLSVSSFVFASKGGDDKGKKGYVLKFNGFEVKKTYLSPLSLIQQAATYKGTISPMQTPNGQPGASHSIITYQKGNTLYIYPLQHKGMVQRFKTPEKVNR